MFTTDYYTDLQWMHKLSYKWARFKPVQSAGKTFNCRCPVCGDSRRKKTVARFFFYTKGQNLNVDCKNCGYHGSFYRFMKEHNAEEFPEYKRDQIGAKLTTTRRASSEETKVKKPKPQAASVAGLAGCVSLTDLSDDHPANAYLRSRCFPKHVFEKLLYSENFKVTAESVSPVELSKKFPATERLVIPFYDKDGRVEMIQGRSLNPKDSLRYISIKAGEDVRKVFGQNWINPDKTIYVCEGPLDSLFVDNCLATCDSHLTRVSEGNVFIWDCEPRNKEIIANITRAIDSGHSVVIWPFSPDGKVDINDMVMSGAEPEMIMELINENTFSGLKAKMKLQQWKKV